MRCETWMKAVLLSAVALGSGCILAAEASMAVPALDAAKAQVQPAKRAPIKRMKKSQRTDAAKKKAQAATVVEHSSTPPGQGDAGAPTLPSHIEEDLPADNGAQPLVLKGVRG